MITADLALRLRSAGVEWTPLPGDRFIIPNTDLAGEVFVISDMTIEAHETPGGPIIRFNGTTEWALDSIEAARVLWLPREDQLRSLLGERFVRLEAMSGGFAVVVIDGGRFVDIDPERAYARAVLGHPQAV